MNKRASILVLIVLSIFVFTILLSLSGCQDNSGAAPAVPPSGPATLNSSGTATPVITPSPSPVPPESLTYKQKADMIWAGEYPDFGNKPSRFYIFYLECNGQGRLIWVEKENNPPGNGFDLLDAFNQEVLFHVSIQPEDQVKVTPSDFPKYVDHIHESLQQYNIVAAAKLLDINDLYTKCNIDFNAAGTPYDVLYPHFNQAPEGFSEWSKDELLDAFIEVTPAQYILPFWEYIPNAVTPYSYFNPPSPTPVITPIPDNYKEQMLPLLGIDQDFEEFYEFGQIGEYYYLLNGSKRIIWTISYYGTPTGTIDVHSLFNGEYLFSWYVDPDNRPKDLACSDEWKYHSASSPMLDGVQLLGSGTLSDLIHNYKDWGIAYSGNELLDKVQYDSWYDFEAFSTDADLPLIKDQIIDLYLELTPTDYIPPFWEYVPNAVTPDEFIAPSPVISPTAVS